MKEIGQPLIWGRGDYIKYLICHSSNVIPHLINSCLFQYKAINN